MNHRNQKKIRYKFLILFAVFVISLSAILTNFTHTHTDNIKYHQNCPACLLLNSLSGTLLLESFKINAFIQCEKIIDSHIEKLTSTETHNQNPSRAPPIS